MACSKYTLTNIGSTLVNFNYRRCDDSLWEYQVELNPNQTKNIWLINNTYSIATSFKNSVLLVNQGAFPLVSATQTPTPTQTPTQTNTGTPTGTPTQTPTNTETPTNTPTPTNTETPTQTPTQTNTETPTNTPTQTNTETPTNTPTQTNTETPTNTPTNTETPTNTPTNTETPTNTPTPTQTPTQARFPFTVYSGTTSDASCGQYNSSILIYGDIALFDQNTVFYNVVSGPTTVDMSGYYNNSQTVVQLNSIGTAIGLFDLCVTLTPTPTQTQTPTNTPTNTVTNTQTPTQTPTPTATFGYYTYSLGTGTTFTDACVDFGSAPNTIYGTVSGGIGPNVGEYLYFNTSLTTPVQNGYYSNGTAYYVVTGDLGQITSSDPNGCSELVTPTPTVTPTNTGTPNQTPTNTGTPTNTPTPTTTPGINITLINNTTNGVTISELTDDSGSIILENQIGSLPVSGGSTTYGYQTGTSNGPKAVIGGSNGLSFVVRVDFNGSFQQFYTATLPSGDWVYLTLGFEPLLSTDIVVVTISDVPTPTPTTTQTQTPTTTPTPTPTIPAPNYYAIMFEDGPNVVMSGSGAIDYTGIFDFGTLINGDSYVDPGNLQILIGSDSTIASGATYQPLPGITFTPPVGFGSGSYTSGNTSTGSIFGATGGFVILPSPYTSGSFMSGSTTFTGKTLSSLGVTPGSYDWTWGSGSTFYKFTLEIVTPPTPTPTPTTTTTNTPTPTVTNTQTQTNTPSITPTHTPGINITLINNTTSGTTKFDYITDDNGFVSLLSVVSGSGYSTGFPVNIGTTLYGTHGTTSTNPAVDVNGGIVSYIVKLNNVEISTGTLLNPSLPLTLGGVALLSADIVEVTISN